MLGRQTLVLILPSSYYACLASWPKQGNPCNHRSLKSRSTNSPIPTQYNKKTQIPVFQREDAAAERFGFQGELDSVFTSKAEKQLQPNHVVAELSTEFGKSAAHRRTHCPEHTANDAETLYKYVFLEDVDACVNCSDGEVKAVKQNPKVLKGSPFSSKVTPPGLLHRRHKTAVLNKHSALAKAFIAY